MCIPACSYFFVAPKPDPVQERQNQFSDLDGNHYCKLTEDKWTESRTKSKSILTLLTLPIAAVPIAHLVLLFILWRDVSNNPSSYKGSALPIYFIVGCIIVLMAQALLTFAGVYSRRYGLLIIARVLALFLSILYLLLAVSSIMSLDFLDVGVGVIMFAWLWLIIVLLQRHIKRMVSCPTCY
ncbi:unnamed protein product, partial [Mesorhabditis spiculigera]